MPVPGDRDLDRAAAHERVRQLLGRADLRYTPGRRQLVDLLLAAARPVTLPELLEMDASLPQSSTYRTLDVLVQTGAVERLATGSDHTCFELAEELLGHHHHLICENCGLVEDITLDDDLERDVERALDAAAADRGFEPGHHSLDLHGRCSACSPG